jgi:hypothetical protein
VRENSSYQPHPEYGATYYDIATIRPGWRQNLWTASLDNLSVCESSRCMQSRKLTILMLQVFQHTDELLSLRCPGINRETWIFLAIVLANR